MWIKIAIQAALALLGVIFPSLKPPSPEADAQKQKDRADAAEAALKAKVEADAIENRVRDNVRANPSDLRKSDPFELK